MPDMRFAPPNPLRIADRATGLNSVSVRSHNERLLLSLLLQSDQITRLEIGVKTGLSAQTVSVLVRSLEQEGLITRGEAQKGRVGPPKVPLSLNPDGAFSIGISIGSLEAQIVLIDFLGQVRFSGTQALPQPDRATNHAPLLDLIQEAVKIVPDEFRDRLAGVGLALPHADAPSHFTEQDAQSLQFEIEEQLGFPVFVQNDVTAAASGEVMFGQAKWLTNYLFAYIGRKLHGRLVLNHQIYHGNSPVSFNVGSDRLAELLLGSGKETDFILKAGSEWPDLGEALAQWTDELVAQLKTHVATLGAFVDLEAIVLSAPMPARILAHLCAALQANLGTVKVIAGNPSLSPKAVGAAGLPFSSRFMVT